MPPDVDALAIPAGIAVLVPGPVAFVTVLTAMARALDRLIDVAIAARPRPAPRPAVWRRWRSFAAMPRTLRAAFLASSLLFALALSTFVLGRVGDLA